MLSPCKEQDPFCFFLFLFFFLLFFLTMGRVLKTKLRSLPNAAEQMLTTGIVTSLNYGGGRCHYCWQQMQASGCHHSLAHTHKELCAELEAQVLAPCSGHA
jgi:hypothetical protein